MTLPREASKLVHCSRMRSIPLPGAPRTGATGGPTGVALSTPPEARGPFAGKSRRGSHFRRQILTQATERAQGAPSVRTILVVAIDQIQCEGGTEGNDRKNELLS